VALAATGGQSPYNWSVASGSSLPAGLQLNAGGVISGTPTASGTVSFSVQLVDSENPAQTATAGFSIMIIGAEATLTPSPATISIASPGGSGSTTLAFANFTGSAVTVTCSGLPPESNYSVSNQTASSGTLTITTTAPTTVALALPRSARFSYALLLAALPLLIAGARRKRWPVQLCAVVLLLALGSLLGCGTSVGGSSSTTTRNPGTPVGTYPLTVTATSASQSASLQITLKVGQ